VSTPGHLASDARAVNGTPGGCAADETDAASPRELAAETGSTPARAPGLRRSRATVRAPEAFAGRPGAIEKLQRALFAIADLAGSEASMPSCCAACTRSSIR
jgi:hypothetical protein